MGQKSRLKRERHAAQNNIASGLTFRVGMDYPSALPVLLHFNFNGESLLPSRWNVRDARNMANSLLKYCELIESKERLAQMQPTLPP